MPFSRNSKASARTPTGPRRQCSWDAKTSWPNSNWPSNWRRRLVDEVDARSANFPHHLAVGLLAACETLCANRDQYGPTNDLLPEIVDAGETVDREEAGLLLAIAEARGVLRKTVRKGVGTFFELPTIPSAAGGAMPLRHPRIEALHGAPAWGPCMGGDLPKWIKSAKRRQRQKEECRFGV